MVLGAGLCATALRIAIIAALQGELKPLVKTGFKRVRATQRHAQKWMMRMGDDLWIATCAGMGADAARRAFAEAEADGGADLVVSVGWAGALVEGLVPGAAYVASSVIDARTGERFSLAGGSRDVVLVSSPHVVLSAEKGRLGETYGAKLVDMEAATVVRLAQMRGVPVVCIKAISDDVGEHLPDFHRFIDVDGQMRTSAFIRYVLVRPRYWGALMRLGRASSAGAHSLASQTFTLLTGPKDVEQVNRSGNVDW